MSDLVEHRRRVNLRLLQVSITLCIACILAGLAIFFAEGAARTPTMPRGSLLAILESAFRGGEGMRAGAFLDAGLLVLLLTPVARLLAGIYVSARARDWLYVLIGLVVMGLVVSGFLIGQT